MKVPSVGGAGVGWTRVPLPSASASPGTTVVDTLMLPSGTVKSGGWLVVAVALAAEASSEAGAAASGEDEAGAGLAVVPAVEALAAGVVVVVVEVSGLLSSAFTSVELIAGSATVGSVEEATGVLSVVEFPTACGAEDTAAVVTSVVVVASVVVVTVVFSAFEFTGVSTAEDSVEELAVVVPTVELTTASVVVLVVVVVVVVVFCASGAAVVVTSLLILAS